MTTTVPKPCKLVVAPIAILHAYFVSSGRPLEDKDEVTELDRRVDESGESYSSNRIVMSTSELHEKPYHRNTSSSLLHLVGLLLFYS